MTYIILWGNLTRNANTGVNVTSFIQVSQSLCVLRLIYREMAKSIDTLQSIVRVNVFVSFSLESYSCDIVEPENFMRINVFIIK